MRPAKGASHSVLQVPPDKLFVAALKANYAWCAVIYSCVIFSKWACKLERKERNGIKG